MTGKTVYFKRWDSPIGELNIYANDKSLLAVTFKANDQAVVDRLGLKDCSNAESRVIEETIRQLTGYFDGQRKVFDLPMTLIGTDFQKQAWRSLTEIPHGHFMSYGEQAKKIRREKAIRAVGSANGKNAISIIIPCHRVLGSDGKISGYAGGPHIKRKLLELEGYRFLKDVIGKEA